MIDVMLLKILSYNIHKGFALGNRRLTLSKIQTAIHSLQPDIICLQEVVGENLSLQQKFFSWPEEAQHRYLAGENWPYICYGKNCFYPHGHHGNAILSKFPIVYENNHNISTNRIEKRGMLHSIIQLTDDKILNCFSLHLGLTNKGRALQIRKICERIKELVNDEDPIILAGDFNDWSKHGSKILSKELGLNETFKSATGNYAKTFPAFLPVLQLDRIYFRGFSVECVEVMAQVEWKTLSDHLALYAELRSDQ